MESAGRPVRRAPGDRGRGSGGRRQPGAPRAAVRAARPRGHLLLALPVGGPGGRAGARVPARPRPDRGDPARVPRRLRPERLGSYPRRLAEQPGSREEELLAAGLVQRSKARQGQVYDRFRERIMFPSADCARTGPRLRRPGDAREPAPEVPEHLRQRPLPQAQPAVRHRPRALDRRARRPDDPRRGLHRRARAAPGRRCATRSAIMGTVADRGAGARSSSASSACSCCAWMPTAPGRRRCCAPRGWRPAASWSCGSSRYPRGPTRPSWSSVRGPTRCERSSRPRSRSSCSTSSGSSTRADLRSAEGKDRALGGAAARAGRGSRQRAPRRAHPAGRRRARAEPRPGWRRCSMAPARRRGSAGAPVSARGRRRPRCGRRPDGPGAGPEPAAPSATSWRCASRCPQAGAEMLAAIDPEELLTSEVLRRAAGHLREQLDAPAVATFRPTTSRSPGRSPISSRSPDAAAVPARSGSSTPGWCSSAPGSNAPSPAAGPQAASGITSWPAERESDPRTDPRGRAPGSRGRCNAGAAGLCAPGSDPNTTIVGVTADMLWTWRWTESCESRAEG